MQGFQIKHTGKQTQISDTNTRHMLVFEENNEFYIYTPFPKESRFPKADCQVTYKGIEEYDSRVINHVLPVKTDLQYAEIGAGLGQLIPHITEMQDPSSPRPIVVDPANFHVLRDLLGFGIENFSLTPEKEALLEELIRRCDILLDVGKINLIGKSLGQTVREHPEILRSTDVLIDHYGPSYHYLTESSKKRKPRKRREERIRILGLERRLLKPDGIGIAPYYIGPVFFGSPELIPVSQ